MAVIAARHERDANEVTNHLTQLQQQAALRNPSCFDFEQIVRFGIWKGSKIAELEKGWVVQRGTDNDLTDRAQMELFQPSTLWHSLTPILWEEFIG